MQRIVSKTGLLSQAHVCKAYGKSHSNNASWLYETISDTLPAGVRVLGVRSCPSHLPAPGSGLPLLFQRPSDHAAETTC